MAFGIIESDGVIVPLYVRLALPINLGGFERDTYQWGWPEDFQCRCVEDFDSAGMLR